MNSIEEFRILKFKFEDIVNKIDNALNYYYTGYISLEEYYKIINTNINKLSELKKILLHISEKLLKDNKTKENNEVIKMIRLINDKILLTPKNDKELELNINLEKTRYIIKGLIINPLCVYNNPEEIIKGYNISDKNLELYLKKILKSDEELDKLKRELSNRMNDDIEISKQINRITNMIIEYREKIFDKNFDSLMYFSGLLFTIGHLVVTETYGIELVHPIISKIIPILFSILLFSSLIQTNAYKIKIKKLEIEKKKLYY